MTRRAWIPSWLACCAAVVTLSAQASAQANAQTKTVALDLTTARGETPEYVCVLHHGTPSAAGQLTLNAAERSRWLTMDAGRSTAVPRNEELPETVAEQTRAAWRAMTANTTCGADQSDCKARIDLTDGGDARLACAHNAPGLARNGKVLVVDVRDAGPASRAVESLSLEGSVVRMTLSGAAAEGANIHARVAGGHYQPGPAETPIGHRVALRPELRCQSRPLRWARETVAPTRSQEVDIRLFTDGREVVQCKRSASSPVVVELAPAAQGTTARLEAKLTGAHISLAASWPGDVPPQPIVLRPFELGFAWEAPCEYADHVCPQAAIPGSGLACVAEPQPPSDRKGATGSRLACAYRCTSSQNTAPALKWPANIRFQGSDPSVSWTAQLESAGQVLHDYLPDDDRSFPVKFAWEERSDALLTRAGDRIRYVEITTPKGLTHRLEPRDGQRVTLPGARCGDTFASRVVGDREFGNDTARIEDGWLVVPDPKESAKALQVGGMVGGGFILPASRFGLGGPSGLEARAYGTAQLAFRLQPEPHVEGSVFEPRAYEMHLSYVIAQQPYFPVHVPDEEVNEDAEYLAFNRWALEAMPLWQLGQRTQLGVGMGVGLGFPVRTQDEPAVGKSRLFFIPLTALGRIQISRAVSIEGSFRVVGPEKVYRYEPSPFFAGTPVRTEDTLWSGMLGLLGLRVWL